MNVELTDKQVRDVVERFTFSATEDDVKWFLKLVTRNRRHDNDHTALVEHYMELVTEECALPRSYFK